MDPRTDKRFIRAASTVSTTRAPNGPVFRTTAYYVERADFDRMACGHAPIGTFAYRSIDDGPCKAFRTRATVPAFRKMLDAWNRDQRAHTYGARAMESDWGC